MSSVLDWTQPHPIGHATDGFMAAAHYDGMIYLAYSSQSNHHIHVARFHDRGPLSDPTTYWSSPLLEVSDGSIAAEVAGSIALAAYKQDVSHDGKLYVVYVDSNRQMMYSTFDAGSDTRKTWSTPTEVGEATSGAVALAEYDGLLYLVYKQVNGDSIYARTWDGTSWSEATDTGAHSNGGSISLSVLGEAKNTAGTLWMAFTSDDNEIYTCPLTKAGGWGALSDTGHAAGGPVAMSTCLKYPPKDTAAEQNLVILYQEPSESKLHLHLLQSSNGTTWPAEHLAVGSNKTGVGGQLALASYYDSQLVLCYVDSGGSNLCFRVGGTAGKNERWHSLFAKGMTRGTSGIERVAGLPFAPTTGNSRAISNYLVVFDNKHSSDTFVSVIGWTNGFAPVLFSQDLVWKGPAPYDLESISAVPGSSPQQFLIADSSDRSIPNAPAFLCDINFTTNEVSVVQTITLPIPGTESADQTEGMCLADVGGQLVLAWCTRGSPTIQSTMYWQPVKHQAGLLYENDATTLLHTAAATGSATLPLVDFGRQASDFKIAPDGTVVATSADDPGDDGPFYSQVFVFGQFLGDARSGVSLSVQSKATAKSPIFRVKTEAIALTPDLGVFLASDDEHMGSGIFTSEH